MAQQTTNPHWSAAGLGAIVGGTGAAASNLKKLQEEEIEATEAVKNTLTVAAASGVATAAATAVASSLNSGSTLPLLSKLVVGTGVMYLLMSALEGRKDLPVMAQSMSGQNEQGA